MRAHARTHGTHAHTHPPPHTQWRICIPTKATALLLKYTDCLWHFYEPHEFHAPSPASCGVIWPSPRPTRQRTKQRARYSWQRSMARRRVPSTLCRYLAESTITLERLSQLKSLPPTQLRSVKVVPYQDLDWPVLESFQLKAPIGMLSSPYLVWFITHDNLN